MAAGAGLGLHARARNADKKMAPIGRSAAPKGEEVRRETVASNAPELGIAKRQWFTRLHKTALVLPGCTLAGCPAGLRCRFYVAQIHAQVRIGPECVLDVRAMKLGHAHFRQLLSVNRMLTCFYAPRRALDAVPCDSCVHPCLFAFSTEKVQGFS
jgi:hypothetical protein